MIPVIIPLKWHSTNNYLELKYALRSLETYMINTSTVTIIGLTKPKWANENLLHVKAGDPTPYTAINIKEKLLKACEMDDKYFLMYHDDHFLTEEFDAEKLPQFYQGTIQEFITASKYNPYRQQLQNTQAALKSITQRPLYWDVHFPITFNRQKLKDILLNHDWSVQQGYAIKSLYCNTLGFRGIPIEEVVIDRPVRKKELLNSYLNDRPFFSTHDGGINEFLVEKWEELYPKKSKFEI